MMETKELMDPACGDTKTPRDSIFEENQFELSSFDLFVWT